MSNEQQKKSTILQKRLEKALRDNLFKRKAQQRDRQKAETEQKVLDKDKLD